MSWWHSITPYQWLVLFVAWLGWVFDAMDATIYAIVLHPALDELLPSATGTPTHEEQIGWYGGVIFSIFLIGWAIGGIAFGIVADRYGRTKTLIVTILVYAGFTGLAAFSQDWWHLAIYRFLTALGIGGEWAAGAALVAEVWPEDKRAKAAGILQSAWAAGFFLAALFNLLLKELGWRWLFAVGVLPALVALLVRLVVKEPERWHRSRAREDLHPASSSLSALSELLAPPFRRATLAGSILAFVAVFGLWGTTTWTPMLIHTFPDMAGLSKRDIAPYVSYAIMALNAGAVIGYLSFGPLADRWGRRPIFGLMCVGSLIMLPITFLSSQSYMHLVVFLPVLGFFNNGIFSGFPIYLPELFPTRLRATGAGVCFNAGRILASAGPFLTGSLVAAMGDVALAATTVGLVYIVGLLALPMAPETKGHPLPD
ncbi:MFS transporter [Nitrospira sp.]|nr:MFS transporter [Nitrospira sp.]